MEFGNKTKNRIGDESAQKQSLLGMFKEAWKKADEDQLFFNSRLSIFELLSSINDAQTAIVDLHVSKQVLTYELSFDLFYTKPDGRVMTNKGFHKVSLTKQGYIPSYIIDEVAKSGKADVRFDTQDIETLFTERSIKVNEVIFFDELLEECKNSSITNIVMKDRVFYTRIECCKNGVLVDAIHGALIKGLPKNVSGVLYPCGSTEVKP